MKQFMVHDDLNRKVYMYYNCDEAERNTHQYCRVVQTETRPIVLEAYQASVEKLCDLYRKLAS